MIKLLAALRRGQASNYDYFWVIDYDDQKVVFNRANGKKLVKQTYPAPFSSLPHNAWDTSLPSNF